jgi:hypothetical protein
VTLNNEQVVMRDGTTSLQLSAPMIQGRLRISWELFRPNFGNTITIQTGAQSSLVTHHTLQTLMDVAASAALLPIGVSHYGNTITIQTGALCLAPQACCLHALSFDTSLPCGACHHSVLRMWAWQTGQICVSMTSVCLPAKQAYAVPRADR